MGQLNLPDNAIVYIDTAIVIYTLEGNENYLPSLDPLWSRFESGDIELMTSELTLMEVLVHPLKTKNLQLVADYEEFLTDSAIQLLPINRAILKSAAQIRSVKNIKTPDAIHASTAIQHSCTIFLRNDRGFQNTPGLPVMILDQVIQS
jgi:predicted nucleic acid-binding protein